MVAELGIGLPDALTRLGYATGEEVMRAMAEQHGLDYVNLSEIEDKEYEISKEDMRLNKEFYI